MPSIDAACEWMRKACEDWSVGYDQSNRLDIRDGGETDCSALVIWALRKAGFDTGSASYTGNMSDELTRRGWVRIPFSSLSQCRKGDILLNDNCHTAMVISGSGSTAKLAQASIDENGRISGGRAGDQTGNETNIRQVYVYSRGWDCILRYGGESTDTGTLDVDGYLGKLSVAEWQRQTGSYIADGEVSGQLADCKASYPNLTSVSFGGGGSLLMQVVQKTVGVSPATGIIASGTVSMLQGWLYLHGYSCAGDEAGVLGPNTAKAVQRSLNDVAWS